MLGARPKRHYSTLNADEKQTIINMWLQFNGPGVIANTLDLPASTVHNFLVKNGYKRTRQEQLDGYRRLRDQRNDH
jgi:hypothetical protein